jgi:hypothetical protein
MLTVDSFGIVLPLRAGRGTYCASEETIDTLDHRRCRDPDPSFGCRWLPAWAQRAERRLACDLRAKPEKVSYC